MDAVMSKKRWLPLFGAMVAVAMVGCAGPAGPEGPGGQKGADGADGQAGDPGEAGAAGQDAVLEASLPPLEKAYLGLGGRAALEDLTGLQLTLKGTRGVTDQGFRPGVVFPVVNVFEQTVRMDLSQSGLRIDHDRTLYTFGFPVAQSYSEIVKGSVGAVDGLESLFGFPTGDMLSDRWASVVRQQRLLNPHLILKDVAANAATTLDLGVALYEDSVHHLLVVQEAGLPVTLWVHAATGRISRLAVLENDPLRSDVAVEVFFTGWKPAQGGALRVPQQAYLAVEGVILHVETDRAAEVNPTFAAGTFDLPAGAMPTHLEQLAAWGRRNHQHHQLFAGIGIPIDGLQTAVVATELAAGVWHLTGGSHHSLVVEQAQGIVVLEAPLYPERSEAILTWIAGQFPSKPVTHAVASHFHRDHSAGLRAFAARGATIVVGAPAEQLFREIFRRPRTVEPDALQQAFVPAVIETIPVGGALTLGDALRPVVLHAFTTTHAEDMLMPYLPNQKLVFVVDLYNPGLPPAPAALEVHQAINTELAIDVETIAGGHGGVISYPDFETALTMAGLL